MKDTMLTFGMLAVLVTYAICYGIDAVKTDKGTTGNGKEVFRQKLQAARAKANKNNKKRGL